MKHSPLLLLFVTILLQGCNNTLNYTIPDNWQFTVLNKNQQKTDTNLPLQSGQTVVVIYYPEICGFCLNQIGMINKSIESTEESKQKKDVRLICVIATQNTVIMQYYLDEKMKNINTIYIDNRGNFKKAFYPEKEKTDYPAFFVINGSNAVLKEKLNDKMKINKLMSLFLRMTDE